MLSTYHWTLVISMSIVDYKQSYSEYEILLFTFSLPIRSVVSFCCSYPFCCPVLGSISVFLYIHLFMLKKMQMLSIQLARTMILMIFWMLRLRSPRRQTMIFPTKQMKKSLLRSSLSDCSLTP